MRITMNYSWASLKDWLSSQPKKRWYCVVMWDTTSRCVCILLINIKFDVGWSMPLSLMRPIYVHYLRSNRTSCRKKWEIFFTSFHFQHVHTCVGKFENCYHSLVRMVTHRIWCAEQEDYSNKFPQVKWRKHTFCI